MKKLIIIGGGFAGSKIAKELENNFKTTLIDGKNYFEFTPGILRTLVNPEHGEKIQVLHKDYLKKTKIIKDCAEKVTKKYVTTKNNGKINFDYLAICSGSSYSVPFKDQEIILTKRSEDLIKFHEKLEKANKITIIGGGIVGVELAAEIIGKYKNKEICLIHSKDKLMERNNLKSSKYAEKFLRERKVKLLLNDEAKNTSGKIIYTLKNKKIKTDMIFLCVGITPNSDFLDKKSLNVLSKRKTIKVNKYLQVENSKNIFSAGDIIEIKEEKTAQAAENQADIVIKNIQCLEKNKPLKAYIPKKRPMIISLGKYNGIFESKNMVLTGILPAFLKYLVEKKTMIRYGK